MSDTNNEPLISMSGSPIYRHGPASEWEAPQGEENVEQISAHIERHLGTVEAVFHEVLSDAVHIDVHVVKPTPDFPFARLITSGMSDLPMQVPDRIQAPRYIELMITLPGDWQLDQASFEDESWYWPIRLIKNLARLPHKHNTWLGFGHSIPNGDPDEPYAANTKLSGAVILPSVSVPEEFHTLTINPEKVIQFFAVVPLYPEEMNLKLRSGIDKLLTALGKANLSDVIYPNRTNVARKRFVFF